MHDMDNALYNNQNVMNFPGIKETGPFRGVSCEKNHRMLLYAIISYCVRINENQHAYNIHIK